MPRGRNSVRAAALARSSRASSPPSSTAEPHLSTLPAAPGTGPIIGQVTGVYANTNPQQITVRVNGVDHAVPLSDSTAILRSAPREPATQVPLTQLQPGDHVRIQRDQSGNAISVTATFGQIRGTIKRIGEKLPNGDRILTLNDGSAIEVRPTVPVTMSGRRVTLSDVMANEEVVIRTDPTNKIGLGIAVVTPDNPHPRPPGRRRTGAPGAAP